MANRFEQFLPKTPEPVAPAATGEPTATPAVELPKPNRFQQFVKPATAPATKPAEDFIGQAIAGGVKAIPKTIGEMASAAEVGAGIGREDPLLKTIHKAMGTNIPGWDIISGIGATAAKPFLPKEMQEHIPEPVVTKEIGKKFTEAGLNPETYFRKPATPGERIAEMAGEGAVMSLFTPNKASGFAKLMQIGKEALIGAGAGAASQAGIEVAPDWADPLVGLAGGLVGGLGTAAALEVPRGIGKGIGKLGEYVQPALPGRGTTEALAAKRLGETVTDREQAIADLGAAEELVPGSRPTAFQATGDIGLGSLERSLARGDEAFKAKLLERIEEQNEARVNALNTIQERGQPSLVADFFRGRMRELEQEADELYDVAEGKARGEFEALGDRPAGEIGESARSAIEARFKSMNTETNRLWNSIDPDGTLVVGTTPLVNAAARIYGAISPEEALSLATREKSIAGIIGTYGTELPFQRFKDLRSEISSAMREAKLGGNDRAYGRLSRLRGAIEEAVSESIAGKMEANPALADDFVRKARDWYTGAVEGEAGAAPVARPVSAAAGAARAVPEGAGERGAAAGEAAPPAGDQGLSEAAGRPVTLEQGAHAAATSPRNELPEPTEAQIAAGNYRKGHAKVGGLDLTFENPAGSTRSGTDASGKPWSVEMQDHYGYIKGTTGRDKDHLDTFVDPNAGEIRDSSPVFVVDQMDPATGKFDEHKVMIGYPDQAAAEAAYRRNYADDWEGMGTVTPTTMRGLKDWIATGKTRTEFAKAGAARTASIAETMADRFAGAGRPTKEAKAAGELVEAFYSTLANRAGKTTAELQEQFPLPGVQRAPEAAPVAEKAAAVAREAAPVAEKPAAAAPSNIYRDEGGTRVKFDDAVHTRVYDLGKRLLGRNKVSAARAADDEIPAKVTLGDDASEVQALLDEMAPYLDPDQLPAKTPAEFARMAMHFAGNTIGEAAGKRSGIEAPSLVHSDLQQRWNQHVFDRVREEPGLLYQGAADSNAERFRSYMKNRTFDTREDAERTLRYYIDKWNKPDIFGSAPKEPLSYDIIDDLLVRRGKGFGISNKGLRPRGEFTASKDPIGTAPEAAWGARDLQDYRKTAKPGEVVDELYVDLASIPKAKLAGGKTAYDWSELERGGAIPPVTLRRNPNGSVSIIDGNHRIEFFREQGFDSIPAYVIRKGDARPTFDQGPRGIDMSDPYAEGGNHRGAREVEIGGATLSYSMKQTADGTKVLLDSVYVDPRNRNKGAARTALRQFLAAADEAGRDVFLTAEPISMGPKERGPNKAQLEKFYQSEGFVPNTGKNKDFGVQAGMVRRARPTFDQSASPQTPEFKRWFKGSKVVDEAGQPLVVHHGSGVPIEEFKYEFTGQGNDQIGSGFYFTTSRDEALGYTERHRTDQPKVGGEGQPTVHDVYLNIKRPLDADATGNVSPDQIKRMIALAPAAARREGMENWAGTSMDRIAQAYEVDGENVVRGLFSLANDFFGNTPAGVKAFNKAVQKVLGYDGVMKRQGERTHYVAFFPEQIKATTSRGFAKGANIYEQGKRGQIMLGRDGAPALVSLFKDADASTAVHESAHQFLDMFGQIAGDRKAPADLQRDWRATNAWWEKNAQALARDAGEGVTAADVRAVIRGDAIDERKAAAVTRGMHEQWAKAFEVYLRDGKAPNAALKGVFDQFKDWLTQVYRSITGMGVDVSPDIRGVFDRLLAGEPSGAMIDEAAAGRFKAATAATRELKETFGAKPVKGIMRRPGPTYPYEMTPENVANNLFRAGPEGGAGIKAALKAGAPRDAIEAAAVLSAKRAATKDGVIDPAKLSAWRSRHAEALAEVPDLDRRLGSAAAATEAMIAEGATRSARLDIVRKSAVGKLLGLEADADIAASVGNMLNRADAVRSMRQLMAGAGGDVNAVEGLRRAIVDHMMTKLVTPKDAIRGDTYQRYLAKNLPALREVLEPEQINNLRRIGEDLKRSTRDVRAPGGGSDTAENLRAMRKHAPEAESILGAIFKQAAGGLASGVAAHTFFGPIAGMMTGSLQTLGGIVLGQARAAGMRRVDDLIREAVLDPELMRTLLMKAPKEKNRGSALTLAQKLTNLAANNIALSLAQGDEEEEPAPAKRRREEQPQYTPMMGVRG